MKRKGDGMFKVGEYVVYGNTGVCKVEDITTMDMVGTEKEYYVLVPVYNKNGRAFLPVDNTKVVIRPVLTKDEALKLIDTIPQIEEIPPVNDKGREERYKELAKACDCRSWVTIIKTIIYAVRKGWHRARRSHPRMRDILSLPRTAYTVNLDLQ